MKTAGCFNETLASITWDRINKFLPNLYCDLIEPPMRQSEQPIEQAVKNESTSTILPQEIEAVRKCI